MSDITFQGTWTRQDRETALYRSLPFDVPAGVPGIVIEIGYEKTPAAALDLGLSDPAGFRGWSGSARQTVALSEGHTTPGYLRGPIPAGRWHVELGLHRIPPEGLDYELGVTFTVPHLEPARPQQVMPARSRPRRALPAPPGMAWLAGDMRAHSEHSDGREPVAALVAGAIRANLDFVVVADFNTVSHYAETAEFDRDGQIVVIPGQTIATDGGHALVLGLDEWIDLREPAERWAPRVRAAGGLISANHPVKPDASWRTPIPGGVDLAEVWSGGWDGRDGAPLAWWLAAGPGVAPIGGSGWVGRPGAALGAPTTWVLTDERDVLDGLRRGRTAISASPDGPAALRVDGQIAVIGGAGHRLVDWYGQAADVAGDDARFPAGPEPYRLEDGDGRVVALCA